MADPLPEIPEMMDSTQPNLAGLKHDADWATTFGRGSTNLSQRRRYAADIEDYNAGLQREHEAQLQQEIRTNKNAFNFWKATQELRLKEQQHAEDMALKVPLTRAQIDAQVAQTKLRNQQALIGAQKAKHDADIALAIESDKAKFNQLQAQALKQHGFGTDEYNQAILDAHAQTPGAPWTGFKSAHVGAAMKALDPTTLDKNEMELEKHIAQMTREKRLAAREDRLAHQDEGKILRDLRLKKAAIPTNEAGIYEGANAARATLLDEMIAEETAKAKPAAAAAPGATPERVAVNPKTGEKLVFKNGAWTPLK